MTVRKSKFEKAIDHLATKGKFIEHPDTVEYTVKLDDFGDKEMRAILDIIDEQKSKATP